MILLQETLWQEGGRLVNRDHDNRNVRRRTSISQRNPTEGYL